MFSLDGFSSGERNVVRKMQVFNFLVGLGFVGGILVPLFIEWGGLKFVQIMQLQSWFMFWVAVLAVPVGALADSWSRKGTLVLGCFVGSIGWVIYASVPNFFVFALGELLLALGGTMVKAPSKALLYDSLAKKTREQSGGKIFSQLQSLHLVALSLGAPIGSLVAAKFGLSVPLILMGIAHFGGGLFALSFSEPEHISTVDENYWQKAWQGFVTLCEQKALLKLVLDFTMVYTASQIMLWLYQPILQDSGVPKALLGSAHAGTVLFEAATVWFFGSVLWENLTEKRNYILFAISLLPALAYLFVGITGQDFLVLNLVSVAVVIGFGLASEPLYTAAFNLRIDNDARRTTVLAAAGLLRQIFAIFRNLVGGATFTESRTFTLIGLGVLLLTYTMFSELVLRKWLT
ncbi:MAG: MFS transporter [Patescibacteria group bacterium]